MTTTESHKIEVDQKETAEVKEVTDTKEVEEIAPEVTPSSKVSVTKPVSKTEITVIAKEDNVREENPVEEAVDDKDSLVDGEVESLDEEIVEKEKVGIVEDSPPSHDSFDAQCRKFIDSKGFVDYSAWKKQESELDNYLSLLGEQGPSEDWSNDEKLAYWINLYNAYTIKLILKNLPVESITKLHGGKPWDVKWIKVGNETYSLNNVEHDIIRKRFNEPRIHFAVNCAAKSCPPINNKAWTAENLESELERVTRSFINNKSMNQISSKQLKLSKIFEWYQGDFGDLRTFVQDYVDVNIKPSASISHIEYDWSLNGK